jgi:hypothetical protein
MKHYCYKNAVHLVDIFSDEFVQGLGIQQDQLTNLKFTRGLRVRKTIARNTFSVFLNELVDECINKDIKFMNGGKFWYYLYLNAISEGNFNRIIKNGKIYTDVNLIESDFKIYEMLMFAKWKSRGPDVVKVRITYKKYKELVKKVNEGKRFQKSKKLRTFHHFTDRVSEKFPSLTKVQIEAIIKEGLYKIHENVIQKKMDMHLKNTRHELNLVFYRLKLQPKDQDGSIQERISGDQH